MSAIYDWRSILDSLRVSWRDRGPNCSRGHIVIACPFCRDDPSAHLSIREDDKFGFYCYRRPRLHQGRNPIRLLVSLGCMRPDAIELLNANRAGATPTPPAKPSIVDNAYLWQKFKPAYLSDRCMDYLHDRRGFDDPERLAGRYDLRYAPNGAWAGRVLMPLTDDGKVVSWTGRALSNRTNARYLTQPCEEQGLLYAPRAMRSVGVIVEGPMDALKIDAATESMAISAVALTGLATPWTRLRKLQLLMSRCDAIYTALDATVRADDRMSLVAELAPLMRPRKVNYLQLPVGYKDAAEMPLDAIASWLATETNSGS